MCSCDMLWGHSKERLSDFICDLWFLCPAVTGTSQMLSAFGCSNMLLSKGLQQEEEFWNISTQIRQDAEKGHCLKDMKHDFILGTAVYQLE